MKINILFIFEYIFQIYLSNIFYYYLLFIIKRDFSFFEGLKLISPSRLFEGIEIKKNTRKLRYK